MTHEQRQRPPPTIGIDANDLPPPSVLKHAGQLVNVDLLIPIGGYILLLDYPNNRLKHWTGHVMRRLPYHRYTLLVAILTREEYDQEKTRCTALLWSRQQRQFDQYHTKANETMATTTIARTTAPAKTKKNEAQQAYVNPDSPFPLVSSYTKDGKTRYIGFLQITVETMLTWLETNTHNRPVNWNQVYTLLCSWLTDWVPEANLFIRDWNDKTADGQHRSISFILAYGNRDQIERLLKMIDSWATSEFKLPKGGIVRSKAIVEYVPIAGYELSNVSPPDDLFVPMLLGSDPRVADKADQDQHKRTGADQLVRSTTSGNKLAELGLKGRDAQEVLRYMYLRVLPPTGKAKNEGANYGSLRKGGNVQPDTFPKLMDLFADYLYEASWYINEYGPGWSVDNCPIAYHQLLGTIALAIQGKVPDTKIKAFVDNWISRWTKTTGKNGKPSDTFVPLKNTASIVMNHKEEFTTYERAYIASRYIQAENPNPTANSVEAVKKAIGGPSFEQQATNRLPGYDSEGCTQVISKSLAKKLKAEAKQAAK